VKPPTRILDVAGLSKRFGGVMALDMVSFGVDRNSVTVIAGPQGAGKTTLGSCICGVHAPTSGSIELERVEIGGRKMYEINRLGIARVSERVSLFNSMTVLDNVLAACHRQMESTFWEALVKTRRHRCEEKIWTDRALELLKFVGVEDVANKYPASLDALQCRLVEIARALATDPRLLLIDEATSGLSALQKNWFIRLIGSVVSRGVTVLMLEPDLQLAVGIANFIVVLDQGRKIAEGTASDLRRRLESPESLEPFGRPGRGR
jgi:branched-chain amino acid transport system ATP-binding protein